MSKKRINDQVKDLILTDEEVSELKSMIKTFQILVSFSYGSMVIVSLVSLVRVFTSIPITLLIVTGLLLVLSIPGSIYSRKKAIEIKSFILAVQNANTCSS